MRLRVLTIAVALVAFAVRAGAQPTCGFANAFETIDAPSGTDPVADLGIDTLTLTAANGLSITGTASSDTLAFGITAGGISATELGADACGASEVAASSVALGTDVTGVLPIANGGTGSATPTSTFDVSWDAPVITTDRYVKVSDGAITLTRLDCIATGAVTPVDFVINVDECTADGASCNASGGTVTLAAVATNTGDATFTDAAVDDDDWIRFDVFSLTTAPIQAHCRLEYTQP